MKHLLWVLSASVVFVSNVALAKQGDDALTHENVPRDVPHELHGGANEVLGHEATAHDDAHATAGHNAHDTTLNWTEWKQSPTPLAWGLMNFAVWAGVIVMAVKKVVPGALQNKRDAVVRGIEEGEKIKLEAEAKQAEFQKKLANLDHELAQVKQALLQSATSEKVRIEQEAAEKASKLKEEAAFLALQQKKQSRAQLVVETVESAVARAEKQIQESIQPADQERLQAQYLADLKQRLVSSQLRGVHT